MNFESFKKYYEKVKPKEIENSVQSSIVVSICVVTFNHVSFIKKCLDDILMQQTNFDYEILLGEDASTDGTREICIEYAKKYPSKIKLFLHHRENNISINGSPTGRFNFLYNLYSAQGKYIALCEGDDYWTDPYKLQKQVDFLEANPNFNICFTNAYNLLQNNELKLKEIPDISTNGVYTYDDLLEHYNFITTASVVVRKNFNTIPQWIFKLPVGDLGLYLLTCKTAKIKCLPDITTVYRIHNQGIWSSLSQIKQFEIYLLFYQAIFAELTTRQQEIVHLKQKYFIKKISHLKYNNNKLLVVFNRIILGLKYQLK